MSDPAHAHLLDTWESCQQAVAWLRRSFEKSPELPYEDVSADDWDQLEALSGRFARLTDLIGIFRDRHFKIHRKSQSFVMTTACARSAIRAMSVSGVRLLSSSPHVCLASWPSSFRRLASALGNCASTMNFMRQEAAQRI